MKCDIGNDCNGKVVALARDNENDVNQTFLACKDSLKHISTDEIIMIDNPESYLEAFVLNTGILWKFKEWLFDNLKAEKTND